MIDRVLGFNSQQSYYFQLYPVNLYLLNEQKIPQKENKFKFNIYKGSQKFDENKTFTQCQFIQHQNNKLMSFKGNQLNFYVPNFIPQRKLSFNLKLIQFINVNQSQLQIGQLSINPSNYILKFKNNQIVRFQEKNNLSNIYCLEYQIYIERSRFALERHVKQYRTQRIIKSPIRIRSVSNSIKLSSIKKRSQNRSNSQYYLNNLYQNKSQIKKQFIKQKLSFKSIQKNKQSYKQIQLNNIKKQQNFRKISQKFTKQINEKNNKIKIFENKKQNYYNFYIIVVLIIGILFIYWSMFPIKKT